MAKDPQPEEQDRQLNQSKGNLLRRLKGIFILLSELADSSAKLHPQPLMRHLLSLPHVQYRWKQESRSPQENGL